MIKKICFFLITLLFTCYANLSSAQYQQNASNNIEDTLKQRMHFRSSYLKPAAFILPGTLLLYGALKPVINGITELDNNIMDNMQQNHAGFHTNAADYMMSAPSASVYVMDAFKVKTAHSFKQHLIIDAGSILITGGIGYGMRMISRNMKVYNANGTKFPSGHTANAFRGAEIVHQELKKSNPLLSYSGYLVATGVGIMRIYGKEHFLSEVLAGAGLGILSTKLTYWIFQKVK